MRKHFLTLAVLLLLAVVAAPPAMAAGTLAGTAISNQAYADYKDANGNAMTRVYSNTVTTTVSQVAGVSIVPPTVSSTAKNGEVIYFLAQMFNTGNAPDTQTFTYATSGAWTPTTVRMFYDVNNDHVYNSGDILLTETASGSKTFKTVNGGTPVQIAPDDDYDVIVEVTVPPVGEAPDGSSNVITITTQSDFDNTKRATGTYTTLVTAAVIAAVKTHTPAGTPTYLKPGEVVTYTITLTNKGTLPGNALLVSDPLAANLTYVPGSLKVSVNGAAFAAKTDAADNDGVKYDAGTRSVMAPDGAGVLAIPGGGQSWAVQFQATLNAGTPSGSAVTNQATVSYTSGTSNVSIQTNGDTFLVSTLAGIDLNSTATPKTGNPGDQIVYPFTAVNNGNATDVIDLTVSSTQGWVWKIWADSNGDGIPGNSGDYLLTDTNGNGKIDTGSVPQNGTINLLAVATVPVGAANGTTDTITITGISATDPTKTDTQAFTTTVTAPVMSVTKGLTAVQAPGGSVCTPTNTTNGSPCTVVPGSILTYTVTATNSGAGNASSVVFTDLASQYTTYKAGSIKTGSSGGTLTARTDVADGDGAEYNAGSHAVVVPDGGTLTLGPAGTWVLQYQLIVK